MSNARNPSQPSPAIRPVRILPVPDQGATIVVRFLAGYQGILTHFSRAVPIYCPGPGECPPSTHKGRTVWKGYAPVETWIAHAQNWQPDVLEITERFEEMIRGRALRGEVWILSRVGKGAKSDPVTGVFCEALPSSALSLAFDILPVVQRCYHCPSLKFGAVNPLPAQVLLPAVQGEAPRLPPEIAPAPAVQPTPEEVASIREKLRQGWKAGKVPADQGKNGQEKNGQAHTGRGM